MDQMYTPTERSVSPQTVTKTNKWQKYSGFGIGSLFSYFKDIIPSPASRQTNANPSDQPLNLFDEANNSDLQIVQNEHLLNEFSSAKKRRLSIQGHPKNGFIPRSSTLGNNKGLYKTYYDNLQTSREELNNDLERRISTTYGENIVRDSVHLDHPKLRNYSKDTSPLVGLQDEESPIPEQYCELNSGYGTVKQYGGNGGTLPLVVEHEFAPLYKDNKGNLVRPPFINIDPRERYHLRQMKKSIEASQALQSRIKYMVDPKETNSILIQSNKVETSTQTHDADYLASKLSFGGLKRKRDPKKDLRQSKRAKTKRGFFGGDFYYDIEDDQQSVKSTDKLNGYLGTVSKPKFAQKKGPRVSQVNEDDDKPFDKFGDQNFKSTIQRIGLDNSLLTNTKINVSLSKDFKSGTEDVFNVIKFKEDHLGKVESKLSQARPSSGFKFNINQEEISSIIKKRNADESGAAPKPMTAQPPVSSAPKFSFGGGTNDDKHTSFLFGDKKESEREVPKFSFGGKTDSIKPLFGDTKTDSGDLAKPVTPKFSFGEKPSREPKSLLFGGLNKVGPQKDITKLSFGNSELPKAPSSEPAAEPETKKPLFSFGNASVNSPLLFLGGSEPEEMDTTKEMPKFSFGKATATETEKVSREAPDEENNPPRKRGRPSVSGEKPIIGGSPALFAGIKDKPEELAVFDKKPAVLFGATTEPKKYEPSSVLSFTEPKPPSTPTLFGKSKDTAVPELPKVGDASEKDKPGFRFGGIPDASVPNGSATIPAKNVFNFGPTGSAAKPGFNFGSTSKESSTFGVQNTTNGEPQASSSFTFASNPKFKFAGGIPTIKPVNFGQTPNKSITFGQTPAGQPFGQTTSPAFVQTSTTAPAFGQPASPAFGQPTQGFAQPIPGFGHTATPGFGNTQAPRAAVPAFSQSASPAPGGFTRESTPTFAFSNTGANPSSVFGQQQQQQPQHLFNFGSKEPTPDPATIFGASGALSMPQPSQVFGQGMPGIPTMPNTLVTGTPPVRRIAHPRNRRR